MTRRIGIRADIDMLMLPGHRDHFLGPGISQVNADEHQLGKINGDLIQRNRSAHTR